MKSTFEVTSGKVNITDPCYAVGTWCAGFDIPAANGTWVADITKEKSYYNELISSLFCSLESENLNVDTTFGMEPLDFEVGVDSGQCGVFDSEKYPQDPQVDGDEFYQKCGTITLADEAWGCLDFGVVSSSGHGDGTYEAFGLFNENKELIAVKVIFISDPEDYDELLDDCEDDCESCKECLEYGDDE